MGEIRIPAGGVFVFLGVLLGLTDPLRADEPSPNPATVVEGQLGLIHDVELSFPVPGLIARIHVREGDWVEAGQVLATIDDALVRSELASVQSATQAAIAESQNDVDQRYARATMEVQRSELRRFEEANQRFTNSVSLSELDRLRLQVEQSVLAIEQARNKQEQAILNAASKRAEQAHVESRLEQYELRAPWAGRVARIDAKIGQWLAPGTAVVRLIQLSPLRAEAFVDGDQASDDWVGRTVRFTRTIPRSPSSPEAPATETDSTASWVGKIVHVSPEIHPVTGQVRIGCEISNSDQRLRPGQRGILVIDNGP